MLSIEYLETSGDSKVSRSSGVRNVRFRTVRLAPSYFHSRIRPNSTAERDAAVVETTTSQSMATPKAGMSPASDASSMEVG
jgi:hypothetical protein